MCGYFTCIRLWEHDQSDDMYKRLKKETVEAVLMKKGEHKLIASIERQDKLGMRDTKVRETVRESIFYCEVL